MTLWGSVAASSEICMWNVTDGITNNPNVYHTAPALFVSRVFICLDHGMKCCSCTCDPSSRAGDVDACQYGFACIDQSAPCFNDDDITTGMLENCQWIVGVGNGYCDLDMNTRKCSELSVLILVCMISGRGHRGTQPRRSCS